MPNVMKSGSLNLLEPSGPHRACYGIPLPYFQYTGRNQAAVPTAVQPHLISYMVPNIQGWLTQIAVFASFRRVGQVR
jgi:hypothetical protein